MPLSAVAARRLAAAQKKQADEHVAVAQPFGNSHTTNVDQLDPTLSPSQDSVVSNYVPEKKPSRKRKRASRAATTASASADQVSADEEQIHVVVSSTPRKPDDPFQREENTSIAPVDSTMDLDTPSNTSEDDTESDQLSYSSEVGETDSDILSTQSLDLKPALNVRLATVSQAAIKFDTKGTSATAKLQPGDTLVAIGVYDLYVQQGSVVVFGAVLHAPARGKPEPYRIYAASSHSLPTVRALQRPDLGKPSPAVIKLSSCESDLPALKRLHPSFNRLFAAGDVSYQILRESAEDPLGRQLQPFEEDSTWQDARQACAVEPRASKIAVCGPKGTGKSSFARFLVNSFLSLSDCEGVMLLDLDPGQSEFGLPGDLTLCHMKGFNLGPAYSHAGNIVRGRIARTQHFGFLTPRDNVEHYMACVRDLFETYQKDFAKLPLVVNFSGWIIGRGMDVVQRLAAMISPSQVAFMGAVPSIYLSRGLNSIAEATGCQMLSVKAHVSEFPQRSPKDLRVIQTMSYFHTKTGSHEPEWNITCLEQAPAQEWSFDGPDKAVEGLRFYQDDVSSGMVELLTCGSIFSIVAVRGDQEVDDAIKASESGLSDSTSGSTFWQDARANNHMLSAAQEDEDGIGLAKASELSLRFSPERLPYFSHADGAYEPLNPSSSQAIGQAYVRAIDVEAKCLRVTSPVAKEALMSWRQGGAKIVLVRGRLDMPDWMLLEPYHAGIHDQKEAGTQPGQQNSEFDIVGWARKTDRVQIIDKADIAARQRMRPWRLRRNLETHNLKKS